MPRINSYNENSIKVLDDIEHMRLRKGMYIGEAIDPRQLLSEIFDNAIDEVQAGFSPELIVNVNTDTNTYSVRDFGRGIPHGKKKLSDNSEKEIIEILITKANSGGKFDNSSYNYSSGLNGLGLTITNALSNNIKIISYRNKKFVSAIAYGSSDVELEYGVNKNEPNGTYVEFTPNPAMFTNKKIPIEFIADRCKVASALGFKSRLFVDNTEINTDASIYDLIKDDNLELSEYVRIPEIDVESESHEKMKVAIKYMSDTNDKYFGYTNLLTNHLGGTHVSELSKTIINVWERFIKDHKKIKLDVELKPNDYLIGLRAVCAVFISKPEFSSQTKEKLVVNKKYFESMMSMFSDHLYDYLESNIIVAQQLIKRFEEYRIAQNTLLSRKEISSLIKINEDPSSNIRRRSVVSKLVECTSRNRDECELFLVEGDSALGPYLYTRDKSKQAILPLRGKILNVTNKSIKQAVQNSEICDIANSIGCGIGPNCDSKKSRYDKIIISADADMDGKHIASLVLSLFVNMFPDIVKSGRLYVTIPPLYSWGDNPKNFGYCNNINDIPKNVKNVHRFKGLGEMQNSELLYYLVDPSTRNIIQVEYPTDISEFNKILGTSSGKLDLLKNLGVIIN